MSGRNEVLEKVGRRLWLAACGLLVVYVGYIVVGPSDNTTIDNIFRRGIQDVMLAAIPVACFLRAASLREERAIWIGFGLGSLAEVLGIFYYQAFIYGDPTPPYPSPSDAFYLLVYPGWYAGLILLVRKQMRDARASLWLHGLIGGLACAALAAALVFGTIVSTTGANAITVATNLAYPVADTMLITFIVIAMAVLGWWPGRRWALIGAGLALFYVADTIFFYQIAKGTYQEGTILDPLWAAAMLLITAAGYVRDPVARKVGHESRWMMLPSIVFAAVALGIVVYGWENGVHAVAFWLAVAAIAVMLVQFGMAMFENARFLSSSRHEATTDQLTAMPNRRQLFLDLERTCADATADEPALLLLFDLNGFKAYNDKYGHAAGDMLLRRLGERLSEVVAPSGGAYRLGGDEFCALVRAPREELAAVTDAALDALRERGEGFETSASCGVAVVPHDASDPDEAIKIADQKMYSQKHEVWASDARHIDAVIQVIQRAAPTLDTHRAVLRGPVRVVAEEFGLAPAEVDDVAYAFEVRDIGYRAVPEAILTKPGALDEGEWSLMKTHPIVGERLIALSPTMRSVARIVRSSHERFDGAGYPDGRAGDKIPVGARIVAVAAAFDAMTSRRPYRDPLPVGEAIARLRAGAGSQFDAVVVETFCRAVRDVDLSTEEPPQGNVLVG